LVFAMEGTGAKTDREWVRFGSKFPKVGTKGCEREPKKKGTKQENSQYTRE